MTAVMVAYQFLPLLDSSFTLTARVWFCFSRAIKILAAVIKEQSTPDDER